MSVNYIYIYIYSLTIYNPLFLVKLLNGFFGNILLFFNSSSSLLERFEDFNASTCLFFQSFLKGEYGNLVCSIIWLRLGGSISSPVRYSYLSVFSDDNADIFAASL